MSRARVWLWPQATARMVFSLSAEILRGVGCGSYMIFTDAAAQSKKSCIRVHDVWPQHMQHLTEGAGHKWQCILRCGGVYRCLLNGP